MSFWPCDGPSCAKHALFLRGDCSTCGQHFCAEHFHTTKYCDHVGRPPSVNSYKQSEVDHDEMEVLLKRLDLPTIIAQAQDLRPGFTCTVPHLSPTMDDVKGYPGSGMNFHIPLTWSDGVEWLVRTRRKRQMDPPPVAKAMVMKSEAATLKAMRAGGILAPEVFLPKIDIIPLDTHSLHYFFVEKMPGENIDYFQVHPGDPQEPHVEAFIMSYAKWMVSLSNLSFDKVGSFTLDDQGKVVVGPVMEQFALDASPPFYHGPFNTAQDRYVDFFETIMKLIVNGHSSTSPHDIVHEYLTFLEAKTLVEGCGELAEGPWYLQHGDSSCFQFLSKPDGEFTAVLDWEWAYLTSKGEAFSAWDAFLHDDWNDGVHEPPPTALILLASYEKLGRPDLAECVRRGTKYKMLQGLTSMDYDVQSVEELNDLRRAFLEIPDGQAEDEPKTNLEWDTRAIERYQDDERLQDLLKRYPLSGDQAVTSE